MAVVAVPDAFAQANPCPGGEMIHAGQCAVPDSPFQVCDCPHEDNRLFCGGTEDGFIFNGECVPNMGACVNYEGECVVPGATCDSDDDGVNDGVSYVDPADGMEKCGTTRAKCEARGWIYETGFAACGSPYGATAVTVGFGVHSPRGIKDEGCDAFRHNVGDSCVNFFGPNMEFPRNPDDGSYPVYVADCDADGTRGLRPAVYNLDGATDCACGDAEVRRGAPNFQTRSYVVSGFDHLGFTVTVNFGGFCVPRTGDFDGLAEELLCGGFGGTLQAATGERQVCSGMDQADTFCIVDSGAAEGHAFACPGLFKHVRDCNVRFHRPALNPFLCAPRCDEDGEVAVGSRCCRRAEFEASGECLSPGG